MTAPVHVRAWPSLSDVPRLYPDPRNRPNRSPLLYRAGKCFPLTSPTQTEGRIPLLAVGSNGYPRQLHDKLAGADADLQGIPLIPAILAGLDVAFCPVRARRGYVPVTLAARPGAVCLTWLQWLTPEQLNIISATEGPRYALVGGPPLAARVRIPSAWRPPESVYAWWFDSLLTRNGATVWLDIYRQQRDQQSGLRIDNSESQQNPIPEGWHAVPRDPNSRRIDPEIMSQMC